MHLCLRDIRARLHLTQAEVAARIGCTRAVISHWECGRQFPPLPMIPRLAQALNVPEALLLDLRHTLSTLLPEEEGQPKTPPRCGAA